MSSTRDATACSPPNLFFTFLNLIVPFFQSFFFYRSDSFLLVSVPVQTTINNPPFLLSFLTDDGTGSDKIAHIMGPPDQCQHAASIITELLQSIRAREEGGQGVGV